MSEDPTEGGFLRAWLPLTLVALGACTPKLARVESIVPVQAPTHLLGTWRGALETTPVTLRIFGPMSTGLHAEFELEHELGTEIWTLLATENPTEKTVKFEHENGNPICEARLDESMLTGECEILAGATPAQWLMVRI